MSNFCHSINCFEKISKKRELLILIPLFCYILGVLKCLYNGIFRSNLDKILRKFKFNYVENLIQNLKSY